jgi:hypothetical protein
MDAAEKRSAYQRSTANDGAAWTGEGGENNFRIVRLPMLSVWPTKIPKLDLWLARGHPLLPSLVGGALGKRAIQKSTFFLESSNGKGVPAKLQTASMRRRAVRASQSS